MQATKTTAEIPIRMRQRRNSRDPTAALDRKAPSSSRTAQEREMLIFPPEGAFLSSWPARLLGGFVDMSLARPARSLRVRRRARPVRAEVAFPSSRHSGATFGG